MGVFGAERKMDEMLAGRAQKVANVALATTADTEKLSKRKSDNRWNKTCVNSTKSFQ